MLPPHAEGASSPGPLPGDPESQLLPPPTRPPPPALPQGSELLRDPSLGAQFRVHLVKMVILTQPQVGAQLEPSPEGLILVHLLPVPGLGVRAGLPASQRDPSSARPQHCWACLLLKHGE